MADSDPVNLTAGAVRALAARLKRLEAIVRGSKPRRITPTADDAVILVKLDAGQTLTTTASDSATGKIWAGEPGSETDTTIAVTVYSGQMMSGGSEIAAGTFVLAVPLNGRLQVIAAPCS